MPQIDINALMDQRKLSIGTDSQKWITKLKHLAQQYPHEVVVKRQPQTNDGYMLVYFPSQWLSIRPPRKLNLTQDEKEARRERLINARQQRSNPLNE